MSMNYTKVEESALTFISANGLNVPKDLEDATPESLYKELIYSGWYLGTEDKEVILKAFEKALEYFMDTGFSYFDERYFRAGY